MTGKEDIALNHSLDNMDTRYPTERET